MIRFVKRSASVLLVLSSLACSSQKEREDVSASGLLLYPIAKLGEAVGALGDGVHFVATPGNWFESRQPRVTSEPTAEQLSELKTVGVAVDPETVDSLFAGPPGLGAGATWFQEPFRSFFLKVEEIAGARFDWYLTPALQDVAFSQMNGVILINADRMHMITPAAQYFFALHEAGHQLLGHATYQGQVVAMTQPWLVQSMEFDADAWAAQRMVSAGWSPDLIVLTVMQVFAGNPGNQTHPTGQQRIAHIRGVLGR